MMPLDQPASHVFEPQSGRIDPVATQESIQINVTIPDTVFPGPAVPVAIATSNAFADFVDVAIDLQAPWRALLFARPPEAED